MTLKLPLTPFRRRLERLASLRAEFCLSATKKHQKNSFAHLSPNFPDLYRKITTQDIDNFIVPFWQDYNEKLEKIFLPLPPFGFLRNKIVTSTMFVDAGGKWLAKQLSFLEKALATKVLQRLLEEDYVGRPIIRNSKYLTSHNSIHHLYHIIYFQNKTRTKITECDSILEWGGGYGNMAKIVKRMNNEITYTIVDTPLFCCIQWLYLSTILGRNQVNIITGLKDIISPRKVNILPVGLLRKQNIRADMFIATWSLSESSRFAQDYVESLNFFGAEHLLLAFQESAPKLPDATYLGEIARRHCSNIEPIWFSPGSYYAFR